MLCKKCGVATLNGESHCKLCGEDLERGGGVAVAAQRPHYAPVRVISRLAIAFLGVSVAGVVCEAAAGMLLALAGHPAAGPTPAEWNLGVSGLALLGGGFVLLCMALVLGGLAALRLAQDPQARGRGLAWAGAAVWLCGAALFMVMRTNPHLKPPVPALRPQAMDAVPRQAPSTPVK